MRKTSTYRNIMMIPKLPRDTALVKPWHFPMFLKKNTNFSTVVPWLTPVSLDSAVNPTSGMSWSTKMTKPIAVMNPLRKGRLSTLSRKPRRVKPATNIMTPAMAVATPTTIAFAIGSSSPECPWLTLFLTIWPTSKEPAASGPTTSKGLLPSIAYINGWNTKAYRPLTGGACARFSDRDNAMGI